MILGTDFWDDLTEQADTWATSHQPPSYNTGYNRETTNEKITHTDYKIYKVKWKNWSKEAHSTRVAISGSGGAKRVVDFILDKGYNPIKIRMVYHIIVDGTETISI